MYRLYQSYSLDARFQHFCFYRSSLAPDFACAFLCWRFPRLPVRRERGCFSCDDSPIPSEVCVRPKVAAPASFPSLSKRSGEVQCTRKPASASQLPSTGFRLPLDTQRGSQLLPLPERTLASISALHAARRIIPSDHNASAAGASKL